MTKFNNPLSKQALRVKIIPSHVRSSIEKTIRQSNSISCLNKANTIWVFEIFWSLHLAICLLFDESSAWLTNKQSWANFTLSSCNIFTGGVWKEYFILILSSVHNSIFIPRIHFWDHHGWKSRLSIVIWDYGRWKSGPCLLGTIRVYQSGLHLDWNLMLTIYWSIVGNLSVYLFYIMVWQIGIGPLLHWIIGHN